MEKLVSIDELRDRFGYASDAAIYRLVLRGEIGFVRIGRRMMFEPAEVEAYLAQHRHLVPQDDDGPVAPGPTVQTSAGAGGGDDPD